MSETGFTVPLEEIQDCFQGAIPSAICSVDLSGTPNVTEISIVHRIGDEHVALSRQFFNKTIANLQANPRAQVLLLEPDTGRQFRLDIEYERTEAEGSLFDFVRTRLDAIASQTGMSKVFKLAALDICRVKECTLVPTDIEILPPKRAAASMQVMEELSQRIAAATGIEQLITTTLDGLHELLGYDHSTFLLVDERGDRLYTVASRGYQESGVGSEVCIGEGIIGTAAERKQLISVANLFSDLTYSYAVRSSVERAGGRDDIEREIALPGLKKAFSQMAAPILLQDRLLGLICLQSMIPARFRREDESIVSIVARQVGLAMALLRQNSPQEPTFTAQVTGALTQAADGSAQIKHYAADDSIFIDNDYLIKGVAGRVLWCLLQSYTDERRVDFSNKEIRLDPSMDLPDIKDNLEARLLLLRKRLEDRCDFLRITSTGRGRIRLDVARGFSLREA